MPRKSEASRQQALEQIKRLIEIHPNGIKESEIVEKLNYNRRTANNYLRQLEVDGYIYKDGMLWCWLDRDQFVVRRFEVAPDEAAVFYLMARTFVKLADRRNAIAQQVLLRLATSMTEDLHLGADFEAAARELAYNPEDTEREDVLRKVLQAYIFRYKLDITYHPYDGQPFDTTFSPYLIEPSGFGNVLYAIGYSSTPKAIRTYKIDRITRARLLNRETYDVPEDFPGLALLRNAFSIYHGEETVHVVLRFDGEVARRVQETNWHRSAQLEWDDDKHGYLLLHMDVADTTDLEPWIRGWGASCEVLEPPELRQKLRVEVQKLMALYDIEISDDDEIDHSRFGDIFGGL